MAHAMGALKSAKCIQVDCGGEGCEKNHDTYDCRDVILITAGMELADALSLTEFDNYKEQRLLMSTDTRAYPTMLGIWFENASPN